jgi:hypothetical protein
LLQEHNNMSEEYPDQEMEAIHEQVGRWFTDFINSPQYESLTDIQRVKAPGIVSCFAEYSFLHIGMTPAEWNSGCLVECCVEILPRKMTAEPAFFQAVAPVLSAFFTFLAEKGLLSNARALARTVAELDEEIVAASRDDRQWGLAKSFAMAAEKAGVDLRDEKAMQQFMALYNLQFMASQRPLPQESFAPMPVLPSTPMPVRRSEPKIGRNDPCPCGRGKKFKKCCGASLPGAS